MGYLQFAPQIMKMLNHHPNCNKPCKLHPIVLKLTVHASHITTKNLVHSPPPTPKKKNTELNEKRVTYQKKKMKRESCELSCVDPRLE